MSEGKGGGRGVIEGRAGRVKGGVGVGERVRRGRRETTEIVLGRFRAVGRQAIVAMEGARAGQQRTRPLIVVCVETSVGGGGVVAEDIALERQRDEFAGGEGAGGGLGGAAIVGGRVGRRTRAEEVRGEDDCLGGREELLCGGRGGERGRAWPLRVV